jgi:hypothetical protein
MLLSLSWFTPKEKVLKKHLSVAGFITLHCTDDACRRQQGCVHKESGLAPSSRAGGPHHHVMCHPLMTACLRSTQLHLNNTFYFMAVEPACRFGILCQAMSGARQVKAVFQGRDTTWRYQTERWARPGGRNGVFSMTGSSHKLRVTISLRSACHVQTLHVV